MQFDMHNGTEITAALVFDILHDLISPTMNIYKEWGDLLKTSCGLSQKQNFEGEFSSFVNFLQSE